MTYHRLTGSIPPWTKKRRLAASEFTDQVAKSRWLRIQCVNHGVCSYTYGGGAKRLARDQFFFWLSSSGCHPERSEGPWFLRARAGMNQRVAADFPPSLPASD